MSSEAATAGDTLTESVSDTTETTEEVKDTSVADSTDTSPADKPAETASDDKSDAASSLTNAEETSESDEPKAYEAFTLPEGVEMDQGALERFEPLMQKREMDQEEAQEFVDAFAELRQAETQQANEAVEQQRVTDLETIKNDPLMGGKNFEGTKASVTRVMRQPGGSELNGLMRVHGIDNHPTFVKFLAGLGGQMSEDDTIVTPDNTTQEGNQGKTHAEVLYGGDDN